MKSFEFLIPTKIVFGRGKIETLNNEIDKNISRILIVTDKNSGEKSGALKAIKTQLKDRFFEIYDGVEENPSLQLLEDGRKVTRAGRFQLIIAVGGGSPMDAAKGFAVLATNDGSMREYMQGRALENKPLPVICIPTTSGTGSEVTPYAVFSDHEQGFKGGFAHPGIFPIISIIDPELTFSMPSQLVVNTGLDALTHAIESYLSTDSNILTDALALHSIKTIIENLSDAAKMDEEAMCLISYASMVAGIVITHAGTILLHIMGYPLTIYHNIHHGKANAILLPQFLEFMLVNSTVKEKVAEIDNLFKPFGGSRKYIEDFGISTRLSTYGIKESELKLFAEKTIVKGDIKITPAHLTVDTIIKIYTDTL
ncbi:MAG: iron-containing alcohol dehydrogenase [Bacteroidales bacterium]|nr:MAG: iron-containing alcohol dehydrogenase [Bacteroidales bacterium]